MSKKKSSVKYLAMWDMNGLESLINITLSEQEVILATLKDEPVTVRNPIQYMILRAQANPQRHYEIYCFTSKMSEKEILDFFEHDPQTIVDVIRSVGGKIYSNTIDNSKRVIV